ncbi:sulfate/molybdate ABC transporter ATP-binding protein [Labedella endophytica]|uniref:ABC transporter ATP-binding protein n=1 Tax=Labedella endophytica TaxID=1523160 RepID=A0A433JVH5_9MICO|nr:ABC transporter ATP-binding protein [Labedella endophytica]RUR03140.1 ABC transporter ATP-binding protein [Labedella endophytica]
MTFEVDAEVLSRGFDARITVAEGETVALLGPNGAGKSTLLGLAAGLIAPDRGRATLGGRVLLDVGSSGRQVVLPAWRRGVSLLAQEALLFPHLTVRENVAFGPRSTGASRAEARRSADAWLERVDATDLARRRPAELSGGQAQRVAVARALATEPELLLLDEPLAALDVSVAPAIRRLLREVLQHRTAIVVTHDVLDAYTLADRIVVLEAGRVVDAGPARAVLDRPTTPFAAGLAGLNLLVGTADADGAVVLDDGQRLSARSAGALEPGAAAALAVRPSAVRVLALADPGHHDNTITATVSDVEPRGDVVRIRAGRIAADVTPAEAADLDLQPATAVHFVFSAEDALAYPV